MWRQRTAASAAAVPAAIASAEEAPTVDFPVRFLLSLATRVYARTYSRRASALLRWLRCFSATFTGPLARLARLVSFLVSSAFLFLMSLASSRVVVAGGSHGSSAWP
jgi:hypothetical protein